jgi:transcription elongation factor Elf1
MQRTEGRPSLDQRERSAAAWRKWNEPRVWSLTCPSCEHEGTVHTTLKRLRSSNLKCSACGAYLWRK